MVVSTAPTVATLGDGTQVSSGNPTLTVANAGGDFVSLPGDAVYRFLVHNPAGAVVADAAVPQGSGSTSCTLGPTVLADTVYTWYARVEVAGRVGPWSPASTFVGPPARVPDAPAPGGGGGGGGGPVGGNRSISPDEALSIIVNVHDSLGFNFGASSSRNSRVDQFWTMVAVVHYGHSVFNPQGGDDSWCVKSASAARPPSDDVLVRCNGLEAYDTILSAGANGYTFQLAHLGDEVAGQLIYAPPQGNLPALVAP